MREYIKRHEYAKERLAEFEEMTLRAKGHKTKYARVKEWFLAAYPDISDFTPKQFQEIENFEIAESPITNSSSLPLAG